MLLKKEEEKFKIEILIEVGKISLDLKTKQLMLLFLFLGNIYYKILYWCNMKLTKTQLRKAIKLILLEKQRDYSGGGGGFGGGGAASSWEPKSAKPPGEGFAASTMKGMGKAWDAAKKATKVQMKTIFPKPNDTFEINFTNPVPKKLLKNKSGHEDWAQKLGIKWGPDKKSHDFYFIQFNAEPFDGGGYLKKPHHKSTIISSAAMIGASGLSNKKAAIVFHLTKKAKPKISFSGSKVTVSFSSAKGKKSKRSGESRWARYIRTSKPEDKKYTVQISRLWYRNSKKIGRNQGFGSYIKWYKKLIKTGHLGTKHKTLGIRLKDGINISGKTWNKGDDLSPKQIDLILRGL